MRLLTPFIALAVSACVGSVNNADTPRDTGETVDHDPPDLPTQLPQEPVLAVRFNGPEVVTSIGTFHSEADAGVTVAGAERFTTSTVFHPTLGDPGFAALTTSAIWNDSGAMTVELPVPDGTYHVVLYVGEDNAAQSFQLAFEGGAPGETHTTGDASTWHPIGPFEVDVRDGSLSVLATGEHLVLFALAAYTGAAPQPMVTAINVNGPTVATSNGTFTAEADSGIVFAGIRRDANARTYTPATDSGTADVLGTYVWNSSGAMTAELALDDGTYDIFVLTGEDDEEQQFALTLEGQAIGGVQSSGTPGTWRVFGPLTARVDDGSLSLGATGGHFILFGLAVYVHMGEPLPTTRPPIDAELSRGIAFIGLEGTHQNLPGRFMSEVYLSPDSHLRYYADRGMDHFRIEGIWERLQPRLKGALGEQLLDGDGNEPLRNPVNFVRHELDRAQENGLKVILDLNHNYGRRYVGYNGNWNTKHEAELGSAEVPIDAFVDYTVKILKEFGSHPAVYAIEPMNEPHDLAIGGVGWANACQAAIDAIRAIDTEIYIVIDGYQWSSAAMWPSVNPTLHTLHDPSDRLIFSGHLYFDDNGSGTYSGGSQPAPADKEIGAKRLKPFIDWLNDHGLAGHGNIGEFGAPNFAAWQPIIENFTKAANAANISLTAHINSPYPNDTYQMNLMPTTSGPNHDVVGPDKLLMTTIMTNR